MNAFDFALRLNRAPTDDEIEALYEAGCDDGAVESGPKGASVHFDREADSWAVAIGSAIRDIETVPGLRVVGAGQLDEVTLLDIAQRTGRSREAVRLWTTGRRGRGGFPEPDWISPSGEKFWRWPGVARWVRNAVGLDVPAPPEEIGWVDDVLRAREALAEAGPALRHEMESLLHVA
jgi:hypothetical protein